jgi:hypothetical protein
LAAGCAVVRLAVAAAAVAFFVIFLRFVGVTPPAAPRVEAAAPRPERGEGILALVVRRATARAAATARRTRPALLWSLSAIAVSPCARA